MTTVTIVPGTSTTATPRWLLTLAFQGEFPRRYPIRLDLSRFRQIDLGRGPERALRAYGGGTIRIEVDDRTVSREHARLVLRDDTWCLEDCGAKNGTSVDGRRVLSASLPDGGVIVLGTTVLVLRCAEASPSSEVLDLEEHRHLSAAMLTLEPRLAADLTNLHAATRSDVPVLVLGETGTGKELLARAIHASAGRGGRFVALNCGAMPDTLIATELFGVKRGAFSDAFADRPGLIRSADAGTLFLDEIGEMSPRAQIALLRVLQDRMVTPLGATSEHEVDVRFVAATHRDLSALVAQGTFREDLLARLGGMTITLPPLRERREDLGLVVANLLSVIGAPRDVTFAPEATAFLFARLWRKNIRELRHCLAATVSIGVTEIQRSHLEGFGDALSSSIDQARARQVSTADELQELLQRHNGNLSAVARSLETSRTQVARMITRFGLDRGGKPSA
jgi:transcriptional regulator with PAS, ATPase and Fis domain